jgi:hypothetical protein
MGFEGDKNDFRNSNAENHRLSPNQNTSSDSDPHPFFGLDEDFSIESGELCCGNSEVANRRTIRIVTD